jgi:hypothetical protein
MEVMYSVTPLHVIQVYEVLYADEHVACYVVQEHEPHLFNTKFSRHKPYYMPL